MTIKIDPFFFLKVMITIIICLVLINILGLILDHGFNHDYAYGLIPLFDLDTEQNIPTYYSAAALLLSSSLLLLISFLDKKIGLAYIAWLVLSIIFLYLSFDEITVVHEHTIEYFRELFNTSGYFYWAWVIPYGIALLVFALLYIPFLRNLPKRIMILFILSGGLFVTGAIFIELLGAEHAELLGENTVVYSILYTCEETLEMIGIALFIYTLLSYIELKHKNILVDISSH